MLLPALPLKKRSPATTPFMQFRTIFLTALLCVATLALAEKKEIARKTRFEPTDGIEELKAIAIELR